MHGPSSSSSIGKTLFLLYVLARRLHQRKPVAFQIDGKKYALFRPDGVTLHDSSSRNNHVPKDTWALSDADTSPERNQICFAFLQSEFHIIHTSSPSSSRWKSWVKRVGAGKYIMDVWSLQEVQTLLCVVLCTTLLFH